MVDHGMSALATAPSMTDTPGAKATDRVVWIDGARGIGIILVVLGHALGGMLSAGQLDPQGLGRVVFVEIYTFHMPLFFLLSGLFIAPRLEKGVGGFLRASLITIVLPYFLWGALQSLIIALAGSLVTAPVPLNGMLIVQMLWSPPSQFWFLYALFFLQLGSALIVPALGASRLLILAVAARLSLEFVAQPIVIDILLRNSIFFALGVWLGPGFVKRIASSKPRFEVIAMTGLVWLTFAYDCVKAGGEFTLLAAFPAALTGIAFVILLSLRLPSALQPVLVYLGQRSMPIYLLHVFVVAGTRILFLRFLGIDAPILIIVFAVSLGLLLPLAADRFARRLGVGRAVGFG